MLPRVLVFALVLGGISGTATAQLTFLETRNINLEPAKIPLTADVTATLTAETPWGPVSWTESGKYYRSRSGKIRQDMSFGTYKIIDLKTQETILIDARAKIADVQEVIASAVSFTVENTTNFDPDGLSPEVAKRAKKIGENEVQGHKATGRRWEIDGCTYEVWTAKDIKLRILYQYTAGHTTVTQRYENIQIVEPDADLFKIPDGFTVRRNESVYLHASRIGLKGTK
jgi:hypothetical protein